jgi:cell wall-associated NlpC family hydrolase
MRKLIFLLLILSFSSLGFVQYKHSFVLELHFEPAEILRYGDNSISITHNYSFKPEITNSIQIPTPEVEYSNFLLDSITSYSYFFQPEEREDIDLYLYPIYSEEAANYYYELEIKEQEERARRARRNAARYSDPLPTIRDNKYLASEGSVFYFHADTLDSITGKIISCSKQFLGLPYRYGGSSPAGFDCSGFAMYVYNSIGVGLPRMSHGQSKMGTVVELKNAKPGDLIFFGNRRRNTYVTRHTGIVIANNNGNISFIHSSRRGIVIDDVNSSSWNGYYKRRLLFVKRILQEEELPTPEEEIIL